MNTTVTKQASGKPGRDFVHRAEPGDAAGTGRAEDRLFSSDFVFATLANFANAFGMQMLVATLPVYVIHLGGSTADAGLVSGATALTALLFRPLVGWLTDVWRRRPVVMIGTASYGFASVFYLLAGSLPFLVVGRFVHGFGVSCYTTAANAYVADIAPLKRRAEAVGLFSAAQAVGLIIAPVVGFILVGSIGFRRLFWVTAGLAFVALALSMFTRERRSPKKADRHPWSPRTDIVAFDALPVAWMALCMGIGFGAVNAFISIFARLHDIQNPGFYFMIQAVALLVSRTFAGRLADRRGRAVAIIPGIFLMSSALALLPLAQGLLHFAVSASLFGLGFGTAQPATMALLIDRVRSEQRGLATGTYFTGFDLGIVIGSMLLGAVSQRWGFGMMWSIAAAFTLLGLAGLRGGQSR